MASYDIANATVVSSTSNATLVAKRWSSVLAVEALRKSYWMSRFVAEGAESSAPVMLLNDLSSQAGDEISFDLSVQLTGEPVMGDAQLDDKLKKLSFFSDKLSIDQARQGVDSGGRMTAQRTVHQLRTVARRRLADYFGRLFDEVLTLFASGMRGDDVGFILPTSATGFAGNAFQAPDAGHLIFAGDAATAADLTDTDTPTLALVDKCVAMAKTMVNPIQPISVDGADRYVFMTTPWGEYALRQSAGSESSWISIQKALAGAVGRDSEIFKGGLGIYGNVVLHVNERPVTFAGGAADAVPCARNLFLGQQALTMAFGQAAGSRQNGGPARFAWKEDATVDLGNRFAVAANSVFGVKKTRFDSKDFGLISVDCADPVH